MPSLSACSGNIGFAFSFCTNLTISGIKFKGCGAYQDSFDVHISDVAVRNGSGIGLLVVNVCGLFVLSDSEFTNNTCIFSKDSVNIISSSTDIVVKNSYLVL